MKYLNFLANLAIVLFFVHEATVPNTHNWLDFAGIICWSVITGIELQKDMDENS